MYVVTVTFALRADAMQSFLPLMLGNARQSLADERGCQVFDVCTDPDNPRAIFLYEVYDDRDAFAALVASGHFKTFDRASAPMVETKSVRIFERVDEV